MQNLPIHPELTGVAALDNALAFIKAHPDKHDQALWGEDPSLSPEEMDQAQGITCGTHACVAGWISVFAGAEISYVEGSMKADGQCPSFVASRVLGISEYDGAYRAPFGHDRGLFHSENTLEDLLRLRDLIADGTY